MVARRLLQLMASTTLLSILALFAAISIMFNNHQLYSQ